MGKRTCNWIIYALTALVVAVYLITHFKGVIQVGVAAVILLILLPLHRVSNGEDTNWTLGCFMIAWTLLYLLLPLKIYDSGDYLNKFLNAFNLAPNLIVQFTHQGAVTLLAFAAAIILFLFLNAISLKRPFLLICVLRFGLAWLMSSFVFIVSQGYLFTFDILFDRPITSILFVLFSMLMFVEIHDWMVDGGLWKRQGKDGIWYSASGKSVLSPRFKGRVHTGFLISVSFLVLDYLLSTQFRFELANNVLSLTPPFKNILPLLAIVFVTSGLLLFVNFPNPVENGRLLRTFELGILGICWCVYALLCYAQGDFTNPFFSIFTIPLIDFTATAYQNRNENKPKSAMIPFFIICGVCLFASFTLGKAFRSHPLAAVCMIILGLLTLLCLPRIQKKVYFRSVKDCFLGCSAIILLLATGAFSDIASFSKIQAVILLAAFFMCVFWGLVVYFWDSRTDKLTSNLGNVRTDLVSSLMRYVPTVFSCLFFLIALLRIYRA